MIASNGDRSLLDLRARQEAEVTALATENAGRLERLSALGLVPGARVVLRQRQPAVVILVGETELALDHSIAALVQVRPTPIVR